MDDFQTGSFDAVIDKGDTSFLDVVTMSWLNIAEMVTLSNVLAAVVLLWSFRNSRLNLGEWPCVVFYSVFSRTSS